MKSTDELNWNTLNAAARRQGFESGLDWCFSLCPIGDWPGRSVVDLGDVGDPGYWLEDNLCGDELQGDLSTDQVCSEELTQSYLQKHSEIFLESYRSILESEEAYQHFVAVVEEDFVAFLQEWRKRVLAELEMSDIDIVKNAI